MSSSHLGGVICEDVAGNKMNLPDLQIDERESGTTNINSSLSPDTIFTSAETVISPHSLQCIHASDRSSWFESHFVISLLKPKIFSGEPDH